MSADRVLVTGGAGYIGSHACKALAQAGYEPVCYDNMSIGNRFAVRYGPLETGDVMDAERLAAVVARYKPVAAMHFAALLLVGESMREPARYWRNNVGGLVNLLEALRVNDVGTVVFSSTAAVYGLPETMPVAESAPRQPINPYGSSKLAAEMLLRDYATCFGLRYAALRYFNAAGADPETEIGEARAVETHLVPLALDAVLDFGPPLTVLGTDYPTEDGTAVRDYVHVMDLAEAHVKALAHLRAGGDNLTLNLGTGRGYSVKQVIDTAEQVTGHGVPHKLGPRRAGDASVLVAESSQAKTLLGLEFARSDLTTILQHAWAWHQIKQQRLRAQAG